LAKYEEVPVPSKASLETLKKKAEEIIAEFKRFCERLGGRLEGNPYDLFEGLSCILPRKADVKVDVTKKPIYVGDRIDRWYVDVEVVAVTEDGHSALFHEKSHTVEVGGANLQVKDLETQHTEYLNPAFEWTRLEASGVTEIKLRTHYANANIELDFVGEKR